MQCLSMAGTRSLDSVGSQARVPRQGEQQSFEQPELLQVLAHFFLGVGTECKASGDVLWLLQPQQVVNVLLLQGLSQLLEGALIRGLQGAEGLNSPFRKCQKENKTVPEE